MAKFKLRYSYNSYNTTVRSHRTLDLTNCPDPRAVYTLSYTMILHDISEGVSKAQGGAPAGCAYVMCSEQLQWQGSLRVHCMQDSLATGGFYGGV